MATIMKHVGKVGNKPCVVVFRELPDEPENCLVVVTGNLAPQQHDDLMMVVQSSEAQSAGDISSVLNRRQFSDGSNMLNGLHFAKKLQKVSVSQVNLTPTPAQSIALSEVNAEIRKMDSHQGVKTNPDSLTADVEKTLTAPVTNEHKVESTDAAQGLMIQAELLEEDAKRLVADAAAKRAEAIALNPDLAAKKGPGRPKKPA